MTHPEERRTYACDGGESHWCSSVPVSSRSGSDSAKFVPLSSHLAPVTEPNVPGTRSNAVWLFWLITTHGTKMVPVPFYCHVAALRWHEDGTSDIQVGATPTQIFAIKVPRRAILTRHAP